jgi:hypothetical protein
MPDYRFGRCDGRHECSILSHAHPEGGPYFSKGSDNIDAMQLAWPRPDSVRQKSKT